MAEETPYRLALTEDAEEDLRRLDKPVARRVIKKLRWLAAHAEVYPH